MKKALETIEAVIFGIVCLVTFVVTVGLIVPYNLGRNPPDNNATFYLLMWRGILFALGFIFHAVALIAFLEWSWKGFVFGGLLATLLYNAIWGCGRKDYYFAMGILKP